MKTHPNKPPPPHIRPHQKTMNIQKLIADHIHQTLNALGLNTKITRHTPTRKWPKAPWHTNECIIWEIRWTNPTKTHIIAFLQDHVTYSVHNIRPSITYDYANPEFPKNLIEHIIKERKRENQETTEDDLTSTPPTTKPKQLQTQ